MPSQVLTYSSTPPAAFAAWLPATPSLEASVLELAYTRSCEPSAVSSASLNTATDPWALPNSDATLPTASPTRPTVESTGPAAAATPARAMTEPWVFGSMSAKAWAASATPSTSGCRASSAEMSASVSGRPTVMAIASTLFLRTSSLDCMDSLRWSTSVWRAVFSSHAWRERSSAPARTDCLPVTASVEPASRRMTSDWRICVMPRSDRMTFMSSPSAEALPIDSMSVLNASAALPRQAAANSSALMPAALANASSSSPPPETALEMLTKTCESAEPPISALMPSEDMAALMARMSALESPAWAPAEANLCAMLETSDSVVAMLLPMATRVEP